MLERRAVQPQLGLLKSTMLQLDSAFSERAYGAGSFSDFVEKLKKADYVNVSGTGGRYIIERKGSARAGNRQARSRKSAADRCAMCSKCTASSSKNGALAEDLAAWVKAENPNLDIKNYGFQEFAEFLNFAQDKLVVRIEPDEERGLMVFLGAEFYPPAPPPVEEPPMPNEDEEIDEPQPIVEGQPSMVAPTPPITPKPVKRAPRPQKACRRRQRGQPSATRAAHSTAEEDGITRHDRTNQSGGDSCPQESLFLSGSRRRLSLRFRPGPH